MVPNGDSEIEGVEGWALEEETVHCASTTRMPFIYFLISEKKPAEIERKNLEKKWLRMNEEIVFKKMGEPKLWN